MKLLQWLFACMLSLSMSLVLAAVNINTATEAQLEALPGIGKVKAKEIVAYREQHGGFKTVQELQKVKGIGPVLYEKIKDEVVLVDEPHTLQHKKATPAVKR